jgi:hypothetical protein
MSEVLDWDRSLSEWRRPDNAQTTLGKLPLEDREVSPPGALDGMEPDEEHFREATDNEGAPFDRTYSRDAGDLAEQPRSGRPQHGRA